MVCNPFVLADQVRVEQFFLLGRTPRLFQDYGTWTDEHGIAWAGVRRGDHCFAVTWLAAGWGFDPYACQRRAELLAVRHREMEQADGDRHEEEFARVLGRLRLGQCCERLLWAVHQQVLSARTSVFRVPDYVLADAVWGPGGWPRHWRTDLLELLRGVTWLHVAGWCGDEAPPLGTATAVLTHATDLRGTPEDQCDGRCPGHQCRHHHYLINIGRGFLGILERFAQADDSGVRTYSFPIGGPKSEGPALWKAGKTGRLRVVFLPAAIGEPDVCATLTARQHKLLQALVRETTRAKRRNRKDVSEPEVFSGNVLAPSHGKEPVTCPLLKADILYAGFNGNGKRKGLGYKLSTPGGWLSKAGYDAAAIADFLNDLTALADPLGLVVVAVDPSGPFIDLQHMKGMALTLAGRRSLERLHVRVYTAADYIQRWTAHFLPHAAEESPVAVPSPETTVATLLNDMRAKGISRRRLAKGIRTDPSFLSKLLSGKKHSWPQGLLEKARIWVARQKRRRQARPEKSSRPVATAATAQVPGVDLALNYLQRGWAVLPIEPGSKKPYVRWKPYQERLPTEEQVTRWFSEWPDAGIGLVLGPVSGVLALDVDSEQAYGVLLGRLGKEPRAPKVLSGSAKPCRFHLFFRHPVVQTKAKHTPWHPHLEFRGHKGILVLPPSLHPSGNRYAWAKGQSCDDLALPELPPEILKALMPLPLPGTLPQRAAQRAKLPVGVEASPRTLKFLSGMYSDGPGWNDKLFNAACDLCGRGMPTEEAEPLLLAGAKPWNVGEEELARRTIESAYSKPRDPSRL